MRPFAEAVGGAALPIVNAVDVGAALLDGAPRWAPLLAAGRMRVWGFEPDDAQHDRLVRHGAPGFTPIKAALGRGEARTLHICRYPGCSSLLRPNAPMINLFTGIGAEPETGNFAVIREQAVETRRLDGFAIPPPDYMKLDIQGAELDALEGAGAMLDRLCVVEAEAGFVPLYEGQPLFGDLQRWFCDRGFLLHKMVDLGSRPYRPVRVGDNPAAPFSQWLWADAVFVRDPSALGVWPGAESLLKAALVLHELYRSYDLALHLLRAYDAQAETRLAARYGAALAQAARLDPELVTIRRAP